jgi:hypothetical protein
MQNYPIGTTGLALDSSVRNLTAGSKIEMCPETHEVYEGLSMSKTIIDQGWESQMYCTVPQWIGPIRKLCACEGDVSVHDLSQSDSCDFQKMRGLAIWEAQEAMEDGVALRDTGYPVHAVHTADGKTGGKPQLPRSTPPKGFQEDSREDEIAENAKSNVR